MSALKMLALGIFAGIYIAFAGIASTTSSATIQNASVARLVSACVFPAGMAMVLIAGSELFTGNNLIMISVLQKKVTWLQMLKNWGMVFLGNFIGASFVAFMVVYAGIPELYGGVLGEKMVAAALFRVNQSFGEAFARGVLCNILVCIAVWAAFAAKKVSGKLLMSFWPVTWLMLVCPIPPIPTAAMFKRSLGGTCPWLLPKMLLGAMVRPAKAKPPVLRNSLLVNFDMVL